MYTPNNNITIGQLAKHFGIATQSIRNWEDKGKIPEAIRTPGGHRRYGPVHFEALSKIFNSKDGSRSTPQDHSNDDPSHLSQHE